MPPLVPPAPPVDQNEMTAAVLAPGKFFFIGKRPASEVDINTFHVTYAHVNEFILRATAGQHGIRLTGQLVPCAGCSMAKRINAAVPRSKSSREKFPGELVHIDLAGPYEASSGGSEYVIMFTDSAPRLMRPYGLKKKSDLPSIVERYIADMGQPYAFPADGEFTSGAYLRICDSCGIRRENTAPGTPKHNAPVESSIWRAAKAGHAARMAVSRLFPGVQLEAVKNVCSANGGRLWLDAILWGAECMSRSATTANAGMKSPHEAYYGSRPELKLLAFFQPGYMRVVRDQKSQPQAVVGYFLNGGYNHPFRLF